MPSLTGSALPPRFGSASSAEGKTSSRIHLVCAGWRWLALADAGWRSGTRLSAKLGEVTGVMELGPCRGGEG